MRFRERLREMREKRGMDCKTLSELCGLSQNAVWQYERGEKLPTVRSLLLISNYFGVSMDSMLGEEDVEDILAATGRALDG